MYTINRTLMRQMILDKDGGIRPFCTRTGMNRQTVYNLLLKNELPDYTTICRISEGLVLEEDQIMKIFFLKDDQKEA